jgi:hypothetical protein
MLQTIIVAVLILLAVIYVGRKLYRQLVGKEKGDCAFCKGCQPDNEPGACKGCQDMEENLRKSLEDKASDSGGRD